MNLDDGQRKRVAEWIEQGLKVSEIQNKLASELSVKMTYMDVRFLIDDLKLRPKDIEPAVPAAMATAKQAAVGSANAPAGASLTAAPENKTPPGGVSVTVDQIARPGAMVSGRVTFSDGQGGGWLIDQMGRPGLVPDQQGYRPSQPDITDFQQKLQDELARLGF